MVLTWLVLPVAGHRSIRIATVMDAATGEVAYQRVLGFEPPYVPRRHHPRRLRIDLTLGGKHIYISDNQGTTVVIEPGRVFKQVAHNRIEQPWFRYGFERNECTHSSPVFVGKRLYTRGEANLYCIGEKDNK